MGCPSFQPLIYLMFFMATSRHEEFLCSQCHLPKDFGVYQVVVPLICLIGGGGVETDEKNSKFFAIR